MHKLLIVDDEKNVLYSLTKGLKGEGLEMLSASTAKQAIAAFHEWQPDAILLDVRLPDMSGLEAFDIIRKIDSRVPVVIMTAHGTTDTAIEAMKRGAFDYLLKPVHLQELREIIRRALDLSRLSRVPAVFDDSTDEATADHIVGKSAAMQRVYKDIGRVASQDVNVLILGESGTGKELVARAIFQHSSRANKPFLAINAAAIPDALLESELFGHERGAFTGADRQRLGKFQQADQGTLFLDEIGDMPLATQAKVLRVLQDGRFERVGGNETLRSDVRLIAATNQNLEKLIGEGKFRQDLYYRLKVYTISLPPLRDRLDDLQLLIDHFIRRFNRELDKQVNPISPEVVSELSRHSWQGNVRELQSAVKHALVNAPGELLTIECFPDSCRAEASAGAESHAAANGTAALDVPSIFDRLVHEQHPDIYHAVGDAVDRYLLTEALRIARGNQVEASRLLGISRTTLRSKLDTLGLSIEKNVQSVSSRSPSRHKQKSNR